jgi:3'-phosphoadenosine 5'-phosphosulfate sulfotransferase (PAPS reductase)/FAD synthetase
VSGGKDSTALAWIVAQVSDAPLVHCCSDLDIPSSCDVIKTLATRLNRELIVVKSDTDLWGWLAQFDGNLLNQANNAASELDRIFFFEPLHRVDRRFSGYALGLRAEESRGRTMNFRQRGAVYTLASGMEVCTPLADWTGRDVFACILANDLPLSSVYGHDGLHDDVERIREGWWLPGESALRGGAVWLKRYYPQIWRRLVEVRPEVNEWS